MGEACSICGRNNTVFWLENVEGGDHSEDLGVDGKILLEWILHRNRVGMCGLDLTDAG
jgi:hypothetical protein